jgi:hypothetical protein
MLDRSAAQTADRTPVAQREPPRPPAARRRQRALALLAALALALHALLLGEVGGGGADKRRPGPVSMAIRAIAAEPPTARSEEPPATAALSIAPSSAAVPPVTPVLPAAAALPAATALPSAPPPNVRSARRAREPSPTPEGLRASPANEASTGSADREAAATLAAEALTLTESVPDGVPIQGEVPASSLVSVDTAALATVAPAGAFAPTLPGAGEQPPPLYRTRLPPAATLHYEVRRAFLRGDGEIRWQPAGGAYRLVLEARLAGVTLLLQTSEGTLGPDGLAPRRFLDQRGRRAAQAANFVRASGKITFSGSAVEWPLLPGSQDRLSWMIQLAGIAAGQPELLREGGHISMAVVGARGDAAVWTLRVAGREDVAAARARVHAVKLVRDPRSEHDTSAEIWLDPERSYFPVRAILRNSSGAPDYELLLERIDP